MIDMLTATEALREPDSLAPLESRDDNKRSSDRPFNPWRTPQTEELAGVVAEAVETLEAHESALGIRTRKRRRGDQETFEAMVSAVICDLIHHHLTDRGGGAVVPRSKRFLTAKSRYKAPALGKTLPAVLDLMSAPGVGMIEQEIGHTTPNGPNKGTTVKAGPWLIARVRSNGISLEHLGLSDRQELIVLRRPKEDFWDGGEDQEYEDNETTRLYRTQMQAINAWLREAEISIDEAHLVGRQPAVDDQDRRLRRIFTQGRFDSGGRLFGGFWQQLTNDERLRGLMIDGEPVVELDYRQMAPRIVYSMCGAEPSREDLYVIPRYERYRDGIKLVMNAMLFSFKRPSRMPRGGRRHFRPWHHIEDVVAAIEEAHPSIRHRFFTGVGHETQFIESQVLVDVLLRLKGLGITALPIHDAILVPSSARENASQVMLSCFHDHTGLEGKVELKAPAQVRSLNRTGFPGGSRS